MQLIFYLSHLRSAFDESFYDFELIHTTGFKSAGVMENILRIACENHFVIDIVMSTLTGGGGTSAFDSDAVVSITYHRRRLYFRYINLTDRSEHLSILDDVGSHTSSPCGS